MANSFIKATKVAAASLGVLGREVVLPQLVWRDAGGDFAGAANDTISIRVPAYLTARERTLRAAGPITIDEETETKVDVTLDTDVYKGVNVTDENMTLDIVDFMEQVQNPILRAIARGIEDELSDTITGATYALSVNFSKTKPLDSVLDARKKLNDCNVPATGRVLAVGSTVEQYILKHLAGRESGAESAENALNDAVIARNFGGFRVVQCNALPPDEAYAFHKTAFVLCSRAPIVPQGASWGASVSFDGFAMRVIKDYDPLYVRDRCIGNCYIGATAVYDDGDLNDDGQFIPEDGSGSGSPIMVRAVKLSIPAGS
jgi:hypothetical protein